MKTSIIYIINVKEDLKNKLEAIKAMFKNDKYEIVLINNILNYNLNNYFEKDKENIKIINLSKKYNYIMSLIAGIENSKGTKFISINNQYNVNIKNIIEYYAKINNNLDQVIVYNESKKELFKEQLQNIGMWIFNDAVKDGLLKLYNKNISIDFNKIGFNTIKELDINIPLEQEDICNYYIIKSKLGFDESIL